MCTLSLGAEFPLKSCVVGQVFFSLKSNGKLSDKANEGLVACRNAYGIME